MSAPHLIPIPGPAADFGAGLRAQLPVLRSPRTLLRAPRLEDATLWCQILLDDAAGHLGGPFDLDSAFTDFAATVVVVLPEAVSGAVPEDEWLITCALPFVTYAIDGCDVEHCKRLFNNR